MEQEYVDPVYKYIDEKLKSIKHDFKQELLKTQRHISAFIITSTTENTILTLRKLKSQEAKDSINQLIASASAIKIKTNTAKDPLSIAAKFHKECYDSLKEFGIKTISLS